MPPAVPPHQPVKSRIGHFVARTPITVRDCLAGHFRLSPPEIDRLFELGALYLDKRRVDGDCRLEAGAYLRVHLEPKRFATDRINWAERIVGETADYLVADKPRGVPVHATVDNRVDNALHQLRCLRGPGLCVTQRLDIPAGGLFVLAKTPAFQRDFNYRLARRQVTKRYRVLVEVAPPPGLHTHYMEPSERAPRKVSPRFQAGWADCQLTVLGTRGVDGAVEVDIDLHTGRTHQIRAQLSAMGSPVLGDASNGSARGFRHGIALQCTELGWDDAMGNHRWRLPPPWEPQAR